jgi:protein involved in polysaccharide export with SLBB domain
MRVARFLVPLLLALAAAGCARRDAAYVVDPVTGQPVPVIQRYGQPAQSPGQYAQNGDNRALYGSPQAAQQEYAEPAMSPSDAEGSYEQTGGRGLFSASRSFAQPQYAQRTPQQSYVVQYQREPQQSAGGPYVDAPSGYASASPTYTEAYTLDAGDKLRVVVFGQEGISGTYAVDAGGNVSLPLIGTVPARGVTTQHLARTITARLKQGYVREPHVTVTIESYRPFFILGEVTTPGQYAYVPNMTVENAIAVAGGFAPRAQKQTVKLTRNGGGQHFTGDVPLDYPMRPGDTVVVKERWF